MMPKARTRAWPNAAWLANWPSDTSQADGWPDASGLTVSAIASGRHPLADGVASADLAARSAEIENAFARLDTTLVSLARDQFEPDFADRAVRELSHALGIEVPAGWFVASWTRPLDMGEIYAGCALRLFARLVQTGAGRVRNGRVDGEPVEDLIRRWGFHAVDITPCSDGRLAGLLDHVLRVPLSVVTARRSHAGAMFSVAEALRNWEEVELGRWREGRPNGANEPTRYLKIGVYHFSSVDPAHEGCAAHGSDDARGAGLLLDRLRQFSEAVARRHGPEAGVAHLLVGVDTDTDTIRVYVPDAAGEIDLDRFVSSRDLYHRTAGLDRDAAKQAVRSAVAACSGVEANDPATEGMRWLCGYLLKNNIAQVDAVLERFGGPYPEAGHAERIIIIGDPVDDVQLRNLAFQAQMDSVEEGARDLTTGIGILGARLGPAGLAVPILVIREFDPDIPGDEDEAVATALRMRASVVERFSAAGTRITVEAAVRSRRGGSLRSLNTDRSGTDAADHRKGLHG